MVQLSKLWVPEVPNKSIDGTQPPFYKRNAIEWKKVLIAVVGKSFFESEPTTRKNNDNIES
jgi:hypothetical protein